MTAIRTRRRGVFLALPILVLLFLISTSMLSGTFAKYTSEFAGSDTVLVAKWDITAQDAEGTGLVTSGTQDLNLWEYADFTHVRNNEQPDGSGNYIIAPGVSGSFAITVTNNSDVDANISYTFTGDPANPSVPLLFKFKDLPDAPENWVGDFEALAAQLGTTMVAMDGNDTKEIEWKWDFEDPDDPDRDTNDTLLGITSAAENRSEYILNLTVKAVQVTPIAP
jgi:hypothetical protein